MYISNYSTSKDIFAVLIFYALAQENTYNPQRSREIVMLNAGIDLTMFRLRQYRQLPVVQHIRLMPQRLCQKSQFKWQGQDSINTCVYTWFEKEFSIMYFKLQYISRNIHKVLALLCFVLGLVQSISTYPTHLLQQPWHNNRITPATLKILSNLFFSVMGVFLFSLLTTLILTTCI